MTGRQFGIRDWIESAANGVCFVVVVLPALSCWLEERIDPKRHGIFHFWSQVAALMPGAPGALLRRAFYRLTLEQCARKFHVGFGALFSHRSVCIEDSVYIGPYALIGSVRLREGSLVGSRASLLSGGKAHDLGPDGRWSPFDAGRMVRIEVGPHAWIGEAAVVMASMATGSQVAAGAVVSSNVPPGVLVAGNPARFIRTLQRPEPIHDSPVHEEHREQIARTLP